MAQCLPRALVIFLLAFSPNMSMHKPEVDPLSSAADQSHEVMKGKFFTKREQGNDTLRKFR